VEKTTLNKMWISNLCARRVSGMTFVRYAQSKDCKAK